MSLAAAVDPCTTASLGWKFDGQIPLKAPDPILLVPVNSNPPPRPLPHHPSQLHPPLFWHYILDTLIRYISFRAIITSRWLLPLPRARRRLALPICPTSGTRSLRRGVPPSPSWSAILVVLAWAARTDRVLGCWRVRAWQDDLHQHALLHHHQELRRPQAPPPEAGRQDG